MCSGVGNNRNRPTNAGGKKRKSHFDFVPPNPQKNGKMVFGSNIGTATDVFLFDFYYYCGTTAASVSPIIIIIMLHYNINIYIYMYKTKYWKEKNGTRGRKVPRIDPYSENFADRSHGW